MQRNILERLTKPTKLDIHVHHLVKGHSATQNKSSGFDVSPSYLPKTYDELCVAFKNIAILCSAENERVHGVIHERNTTITFSGKILGEKIKETTLRSLAQFFNFLTHHGVKVAYPTEDEVKAAFLAAGVPLPPVPEPVPAAHPVAVPAPAPAPVAVPEVRQEIVNRTHRRNLVVYFVNEDSQLKLRFVELQKIQQNQKPLQDMDNWERMSYLGQPRFHRELNDMHDSFNDYLIGYTSSALHNGNGSRVEVMRPDGAYEYNDVSLPLSADLDSLLRQIGPLDGAVVQYKSFNDKVGCGSIVYVADKPADFNDKNAVAFNALAAKKGLSETKDSILKMTANWIISEVNKHPEELAAYREAAEQLEKLLQADHPSLTTAIHNMTYVPEVNDFNQGKPKGQPMLNEVMKYLFTPGSNCVEKERVLLSWIREKISPKQSESSYLGQMYHSLFGGWKDEPARKQTAIEEVKNFFKNYEILLRRHWDQTLDTLYWQTGYDGAPYIHKCNHELILLHDSKLFMNSDGLMEMDFKNSTFYRNFYLPELKDDDYIPTTPDLLEPQLRHACKLLGLEFLPGINFHDRIIFTPDSTQKLMDSGYHLSESYCRSLMRASHDYKKLDVLLSQDGISPSADVKSVIVKMGEPLLHDDELRALSQMKLGR